MQVTVETAQGLGLSAEEFAHIERILGRVPNFTELSVFSVMWSEHCSYKNSILQLKTLPKAGARVLAAAGEENAGLMSIGAGLAVAFKIESHNHPSAIEPYQGAATGVGGIHRDIFTMGARPIATLNSLRFGDLALPKTQRLLKGVVRGIGGYGNAFGVPTVGGEVYFDPCYNTNPLVNAMSVGVVEIGKTASAAAHGVGNPVFIVGSATGTDGIHGATFASEDISEASEAKLPSVQVGDPFAEKLLLEATLEAIGAGLIVGIQDMGAAGITCSTSEMAAKAGTGMDVWLDRVPLRQAHMQAWQILLSESQERMLIVVEKGREAEALAIFARWDIHCAHIGVVTASGLVRYYMGPDLMAEIPAESLVLGGGAPQYVRAQQEPAYMARIRAFEPDTVPDLESLPQLAAALEFLLAQPSIASKHWIATQYDSMVGAATMTTNRPADAAVLRILADRSGADLGLAMTTDCNSRYVHADPVTGCALAVAEAARNLVCAGAQPLGVTNCLNFGNPYNPEVYWQFAGAIAGMKMACEAFDTPVTGGNVSFYNQAVPRDQKMTGGVDFAVFPTPTIGMVGLIEQVHTRMMTLDFKAPGDLIFLLGPETDSIGASEYLYAYRRVPLSPAPYLDLAHEKRLQDGLLALIGAGLLQSAHDVSEGGLLIALLESAFVRGLGFEVVGNAALRTDACWLGEGAGRVVVSVSPSQAEAFQAQAHALGLPCRPLGRVEGDAAVVDGGCVGTIAHLRHVYDSALEARLH